MKVGFNDWRNYLEGRFPFESPFTVGEEQADIQRRISIFSDEGLKINSGKVGYYDNTKGGGIATLEYIRGEVMKVIYVNELGIPECYVAYDNKGKTIEEDLFGDNKQGLEKIREDMELLSILRTINSEILPEQQEAEGELEIPNEVLGINIGGTEASQKKHKEINKLTEKFIKMLSKDGYTYPIRLKNGKAVSAFKIDASQFVSTLEGNINACNSAEKVWIDDLMLGKDSGIDVMTAFFSLAQFENGKLNGKYEGILRRLSLVEILGIGYLNSQSPSLEKNRALSKMYTQYGITQAILGEDNESIIESFSAALIADLDNTVAQNWLKMLNPNQNIVNVGRLDCPENNIEEGLNKNDCPESNLLN